MARELVESQANADRLILLHVGVPLSAAQVAHSTAICEVHARSRAVSAVSSVAGKGINSR